MKVLLLFLLILFILVPGRSQSTWEPNREPYPVKEENMEYPLVYLFKGVHYDYKYNEESELICDITYHIIARPNNPDGLGSVNKIYVSEGESKEILSIQSRVISKSGKVIELDQKDIRELVDEEGEKGYRIFAVDGAELGDEIEYRHTTRVDASTYINETFQYSSPLENFEFVLTCPENLEFQFLVANDDHEVEQVDTTEDYNRYKVFIKDIPVYEEEPYSGFDANKKRVDFRLAYNTAIGNHRTNTYSGAGKRIYEIAHELTKDEKKLVNTFIKENDPGSGNPMTRFRELEHALKTKYYVQKGYPSNMEFLFENGFSNKRAFMKILVAAAEYLELEYELVIAPNRYSNKFEFGFDSWNYLDDYIMYFPNENKLTSVESYTKRVGWVQNRNIGTYALFVRPEVIQEFVYPVTRIEYIEGNDYSLNMDILDVDVEFNEDFTAATVMAKITNTGVEGGQYKGEYIWNDEEKNEELKERLARALLPQAEILESNLDSLNITAEDWDKPFVFSCNFRSENIIEQAGATVLFKIGELIGPQNELYQEKERKYDVECSYNRGYEKELRIRIPEGFEVQNAESLAMDVLVEDEGKKVYGWESKFRIDGEMLIVNILEFYNSIHFPRERFKEYQNVINAAADWNKKTLILKAE